MEHINLLLFGLTDQHLAALVSGVFLCTEKFMLGIFFPGRGLSFVRQSILDSWMVYHIMYVCKRKLTSKLLMVYIWLEATFRVNLISGV